MTYLKNILTVNIKNTKANLGSKSILDTEVQLRNAYILFTLT